LGIVFRQKTGKAAKGSFTRHTAKGKAVETGGTSISFSSFRGLGVSFSPYKKVLMADPSMINSNITSNPFARDWFGGWIDVIGLFSLP
jgi:hypothetical protein